MPDLQKRAEYERQTERAIDSVFRRYRKGEPFIAPVFEEELQATLTRTLEDVHREAAIVLLLLWMQTDSIPLRSLARFDRLPREQARQTARSVTNTTGKILARGEREAEAILRSTSRADTFDPAQAARLQIQLDKEAAKAIREANRKAFGRQRAEDVAITEVTRASSRAETAAREVATETGADLEGIWVTSRDDKVCEICQPLHGQPESMWRVFFPDGPSAHPRCRCWIRWVLRKVGMAA